MEGVFDMDNLWVKYILFAVFSLLYIGSIVIKDRMESNKYYKEYKKIDSICSDIKYLTKTIKDDIEGTYDIHMYSYSFKYSVNGIEYETIREEEIFDMYWTSKLFKQDSIVPIWVDENDPTKTFIPLFEDNSKKSSCGFLVIFGLLVICGFVVGSPT